MAKKESQDGKSKKGLPRLMELAMTQKAPMVGGMLLSAICLKNSLIAQGRYTDAADDILCKVLSAKKRKFKIKYI